MSKKAYRIFTSLGILLYVTLMYSNRSCYDGKGYNAGGNLLKIIEVIQLAIPLWCMVFIIISNFRILKNKPDAISTEHLIIKHLSNVLFFVISLFVLSTILESHYQSSFSEVCRDWKMLFPDRYYGLYIYPCTDLRIAYYSLSILSLIFLTLGLLKTSYHLLTKKPVA